jgi:F0F1-type ATP synthase alpha subunit
MKMLVHTIRIRRIFQVFATILFILFFACNETYDGSNLHEDEHRKKSLLGGNQNKIQFFDEKNEVMEKAENLVLILEKTKDSLMHIPINQRNMESFSLLNIITDQQEELIKTINDARKSEPLEWDYYHQKLKIIFMDLSRIIYIDEKTTDK